MDGAKTIKVAAYARVSTLLGQDASLQLVTIRDAARNRGFDLVAEYVDQGISGAKERRPQLDQLVKDARLGKFKAVITVEVSRLARGTRHALNLISDLESVGCGVITLREGIDTSNRSPMSQLLLTIISAIVQVERDLTRERIAEALRAKKLAAQQTGSGWRCGRPPVATAAVVERVQALRAQGLSVRAIERAMNREVSRTSIHKILKEHGEPSCPDTPAGGQDPGKTGKV